MISIERSQIEKLHAAAKRERADYIHCMFQRLVLWVRARLPQADPRLMNATCCQPA